MKLQRYYLLVIFMGAIVLTSGAQDTSKLYLQRAQSMYANIWKHYRVPAHTGLFSENFPSSKNDTLTYFQGDAVKEKEVSFLWPFSAVASATNALLKIPAVKSKYLPYLDSCVVGMEKYMDAARTPAGYQAYPTKLDKSDRYYDDNGLVGIDYMEAYLNTKNPLYLSRAKTTFKFIISGWSEDLGGGITWLEGHRDQKPACSNGSACLTALKIYEGSKETYYLDWGKKFYDWMYSNLKDSTGIYSNDKKANGSVNRTFWTYNSGWMVEAGVLLYEFTGDKKYLLESQQLAKDVYRHFSNEPHSAALSMKIDLPWFVTVLFRGYERLYQQDGNDQYIRLIEKDLNYAWANSRDRYGFVTHSWTPKPEELKKPKWLLDEGCIAELYARLSVIRGKK